MTPFRLKRGFYLQNICLETKNSKQELFDRNKGNKKKRYIYIWVGGPTTGSLLRPSTSSSTDLMMVQCGLFKSLQIASSHQSYRHTGGPVRHGRVFLQPCKKCLVQCTVAYIWQGARTRLSGRIVSQWKEGKGEKGSV